MTSNKSFLPWLVTVALLSCQPHVPTGQSSVAQLPSLSAPVQQGARLSSQLAARQFQERLDSATAHITSSANGDALALKVQVVRPPMRTQSVDLHRIKYLKGLVQAIDLTNPLENEDGFVAVSASNNALRISGVPKGKNRIVTVEAWEDCESAELGAAYCHDGKKRIEDIVLKAIYSSQENIHDVQVAFTLQSTAAANVIEQLMQLPLGADETQQDRIDLINNIDTHALNTLIQQTTEQAGVHPARLEPEAIAETILSNAAGGGSLLPTASATPPAAWLKPEAVAVQVMAQSAAEGPYSNSTIILQINDPMSEALMIPPGGGNSVTFPSVLPGTWEVIASLQDNQTGVIHNQQRLKVTVPEVGLPTFTTLEGVPVSNPALLTLPPLLSGFQTSQGNTPQNSFPAEATIVVNADGIDRVHVNNNQVLIGGTPANIVGITPEGALQVKLPPNLVGDSLVVTVKTGSYTSESQQISLLPAVTAVDKQTINSSAGDPLKRTVTLTVVGFNPLDYEHLTVSLNQKDNTPYVITPSAINKTANTIKLEVPQLLIHLGPQAVQVSRNSELTVLSSPLITIVDFSSTVDITSPDLQAGINQYFTVKGTNFAPGNNSDGTPYTQLTLNGTALSPADYEVIDTETLRVKANSNTGIQITNTIVNNHPILPASFQVCVRIEGSNLGCDNTLVTIVSSPTLSKVVLPPPGNPLVLWGSNLTGASLVTVGNTQISSENFVVSSNGQQITIANPPPMTSGMTVSVTASGGIATNVLETPSPVITHVPLLHNNNSEPLVITGRNLNNLTEVKIGTTVIPLGNVTVSPDGTTVTINNPPAIVVSTNLSISTAGGTAIQTVTPYDPLYAYVLNFAGPITGTLPGQAPEAHAQFSYGSYDPHGINVDTCTNDFYVVDNAGNRVFKHAADGRILWVMGSSYGHTNGTYSGSGNIDDFRRTIKFGYAEDIANTPDGTLYLADTGNHVIRVINPEGTAVSTLPVSEEIRGPEGVEVSADGNYLFVSTNTSPNSSYYQPNNITKVVKIDLHNTVDGKHVVTTVAGGFQRSDKATGNEPLATATFHHLEGLGMDHAGNIYVAEADQRQIRKIDPTNQQVTVHADFAHFPAFSIHEIRVDWDGNVIVPGHESSKLYRVSPSGEISLVSGQAYGLTQGSVTSALFRRPTGVDFDSFGNLYVADRNWGIRKITRFHPVNPPMIPANCP